MVKNKEEGDYESKGSNTKIHLTSGAIQRYVPTEIDSVRNLSQTCEKHI